jgi:hypothetical protein
LELWVGHPQTQIAGHHHQHDEVLRSEEAPDSPPTSKAKAVELKQVARGVHGWRLLTIHLMAK